ncbi:MAG: DNA polymerase III subunit alpha [Phycisphaerales bacterium]|jgi:DNA polymerase III subunit alpha|nr:DNA polymerase III subunit alpha [Phycisphaerales bacterium]
MDGFVHLHVHSHYSLLDGGNRIEDLVDTAKAHGSGAIAITDHGNLFGAATFYKTANKAGIKPILGIEAYISPTTRQDRSMGNQKTAAYHLVLLAMNNTGWKNLMKLSSRAYMEGFYYKPRIDRELLRECNEGVICMSACLGGEIPQALMNNKPDEARKIASEYLDIFGPDRFYIEIQNQGIAEQTAINPQLVELAGELGVGIVGTNDVHFMTRSAKSSHEVLTCISTGKTLAENTSLHYPEELYLKSPEEMREAFKAWPEACDNTLKIAEMCDAHIDFKSQYLPVFKTGNDQTDDEYLHDLAWKGLKERFEGKEIPEGYPERLTRELQVIADKKYSSYFLIVNDFVQYARANSIPNAPRGSGVATLLGYCLGIADVDPMIYGLLFERFTDPEREEAPDLDIDICQEGRGKVIQYVREKYGHVAQIITYGTLKARAAIRDVGRVLDIPLSEVNDIIKLIPDQLKMTIDKALKTEPDLKKMYDSDPRVTALLDHARNIEGLARHSGIHAAGVIVADIPLEQVIPLCKASDSNDAITQWDGPTSEAVGLMKMDFLGLRTLTIIQRARELVTAKLGHDVDPEQIPLDDPQVFALFQQGLTDGVFQFESGGMKSVLMQMQPSVIGDLIAANAMYRPGPMELIGPYCTRKNGLEEVPSVHELVDDLLAETYGIMAYQEQVMQVLNRLGKLPLNRALTLIKAISKKKVKVIAAERPNFINGANENGISSDDANELFALIEKFAGYGFNKSHSTRYAIVAYQTAYFKVHYPREFLAATLTYECGDTEKVVQYMADAHRMGIKIAPPNVNTCQADFTVDGEQVRFGLAGVKGVGRKAVDAIIEARDECEGFTDLYHFCEFVNLRAVNRGAIEALIKCGAFDALGAHRAAMVAALDDAMRLGQSAAADRKSGQMNFFESFDDSDGQPQGARFPDVEPWSEAQLLTAEKETLGLYITSHPLVRYGWELDSLTLPKGFGLGRIEDASEGRDVNIGCMIASIRPIMTRKGDKMAILTLEDLSGKCEAVLFPRTFQAYVEHVAEDNIVFINGTLDRRNEQMQIIVESIVPIDPAIEKFTRQLLLRLPPGVPDAEFLGELGSILSSHQGNCSVDIELRPTSRSDVWATVRPAPEWFVAASRDLVAELTELLGDQRNVKCMPKPLVAAPKRKWRPGTGNQQQMFDKKKNGGAVSAAVTRFN